MGKTYDIDWRLTDLLKAARCALADLEGLVEEGRITKDSHPPAMSTIEELKVAIEDLDGVDMDIYRSED